MTECKSCHVGLSRINGRTLIDAIEAAAHDHPWHTLKINGTEWVHFCGQCDREVVGSLGKGLPFQASDGVMRTLADATDSPVLSLGLLRFTVDSLRNAIARGYSDDPATARTEKHGRDYLTLANPTPDESLVFSEAVFAWGRGKRVLANLRRHYPEDELKDALHAWLSTVSGMEVRQALAAGLALKGLDVSFVSKHLRMLEPHRFATLDEVLSLGLGYAANPAGYQLFLNQLAELRNKLPALGELDTAFDTPASIEIGIFHLARQEVRAEPDKVQPKGALTREAARRRKEKAAMSKASPRASQKAAN
jgi:hypothetical protein